MSVPGWESERSAPSTSPLSLPTPSKNSNPIYRFLDRIFCLCDGRTNISSTRREEDANWITNSIIVLHCSQNKFAAQIGFIDSIRRLRIGQMKLVTPLPPPPSLFPNPYSAFYLSFHLSPTFYAHPLFRPRRCEIKSGHWGREIRSLGVHRWRIYRLCQSSNCQMLAARKIRKDISSIFFFLVSLSFFFGSVYIVYILTIPRKKK